MKTTVCQELKVVDVFRFADGKTVFVGRFDGDASYIPPCEAELFINDHSVASLHIEGEMMTDRPHPNGYRSVSTTDTINLIVMSPVNDEICLKISQRTPPVTDSINGN